MPCVFRKTDLLVLTTQNNDLCINLSDLFRFTQQNDAAVVLRRRIFLASMVESDVVSSGRPRNFIMSMRDMEGNQSEPHEYMHVPKGYYHRDTIVCRISGGY